jgi:hypothetical protein
MCYQFPSHHRMLHAALNSHHKPFLRGRKDFTAAGFVNVLLDKFADHARENPIDTRRDCDRPPILRLRNLTFLIQKDRPGSLPGLRDSRRFDARTEKV